MAWVRVDEKFAAGPKAKRAAMRLGGKFPRRRILSVWLEAMSYCNLHATDGFIPDYEVESLEDESPRQVFEAMAHGDDRLGAIVERDDQRGGWVFRNYLEYQPSRQSIEEKSAQERERKAKWRLSRKCPNGTKRDGTETSAPTDPDRTDPIRTGPRESDLPPRSVTPAERQHRGHAFPETCALGKCLMPTQADSFERQLIASNGGIFPDGSNIRQWVEDVVVRWRRDGVPAVDTFPAWQEEFERAMGVRPGRGKPTQGERLAQVHREVLELHGVQVERPSRPTRALGPSQAAREAS